MVVLQQDGGGTLAPCWTSLVWRHRPPRTVPSTLRPPPPAHGMWLVPGRGRVGGGDSYAPSRRAGQLGRGGQRPRDHATYARSLFSALCTLLRLRSVLQVHVPRSTAQPPAHKDLLPLGHREPGLHPLPCLFLRQRPRLHQACLGGLENGQSAEASKSRPPPPPATRRKGARVRSSAAGELESRACSRPHLCASSPFSPGEAAPSASHPADQAGASCTSRGPPWSCRTTTRRARPATSTRHSRPSPSRAREA